MQAIAKFLLLSGPELARPALVLLRQGLKLVENHVDDVENTNWIQLMIRMDIRKAEQNLALPPSHGSCNAIQSERWLLEGPWGVPAGSDVALGIYLPTTSQQSQVR